MKRKIYDAAKRQILRLYRNDIKKYAGAAKTSDIYIRSHTGSVAVVSAILQNKSVK